MNRLILVVLVGAGCNSIVGRDDGGRLTDSDGGVDAGRCNSVTCLDGCCDASGTCQPGSVASACGRGGETCSDCSVGGEGGMCSDPSRTCFAADGGCYIQPVPGAAWETGRCADAGCSTGTFCLRGIGENANEYGCVPIPTSCQGGAPTCACMGCICALGCHDTSPGIVCENGTISQRAFKDEIAYLTEGEREKLANEALRIPLARYRYRAEAPGSRRRLGFLIDDQPNPSPAVMEDRMHVDEYGYTSLLLVTIQQQAKDLAILQRRIEALEQALTTPEADTEADSLGLRPPSPAGALSPASTPARSPRTSRLDHTKVVAE